MPLFALEQQTSDALTVWGFVVGVLSLAVSVVGFAVAVWQIRETKHAAEAAEAAATRTLTESKESFGRFVGSFGSRLVADLQRAVNAEDWRLADVRAHDLADLLGSLPQDRRMVGGLVADLRAFGHVFAEKASGRKIRFDRDRWRDLLNSLHARLDTLRAPFRDEDRHEQRHDEPRGETEGTRPGAVGEDQGPAGELGPDPR